MKMAGAKQKSKGAKPKVKNVKKMVAKNNETLKKEGKKKSTTVGVEMMEVTETQDIVKNIEEKKNGKESVATETRRNKLQVKKKNKQQREPKVEQENNGDAEGAEGQVKAKSGKRKVSGVKENQENKENANQKGNNNTGKRKREPEDGENVVPVPKKKKQKINITQKDKCTLFIRFPESLVVKRESHVKSIVGINIVNIRFPNVPRGISKGFCYVEFKSQKEAKIAKKKLEKKEVKGEPLHVEYLAEKTKTERAETSKTVDPLSLYIGRLPKWVKEEKLRAVFPTAVKIKKQKSKSKFRYCHAYVTFKTMEEAQKVLEASKGLKVGNSEVLVMFATSVNKMSQVKKEKKSDSKLSSPAKKIKVEDVEMADDAQGEEGNGAK